MNNLKFHIGSVGIDCVTLERALKIIDELIEKKKGGAVFTPNVDHVVLCEQSSELREAYQNASLSLVDGTILKWSCSMLGMHLPEKISGSDLIYPLMKYAEKQGRAVFLLGSTKETNTAAREKLVEMFPKINIVGGFSKIITLEQGDAATQEALKQIQDNKAEIVLVALGCPKQELWIHQNRAQLGHAICFGIGASLDFVAGSIKRAPNFISKIGLEWLFRLSQEPRRLFYRYLIRDPKFIPILLKTFFVPKSERILSKQIYSG